MVKKFVIYTKGRTGSTAIRRELNSHPEIVCNRELFKPKAAERKRIDTVLDVAAYGAFKKQYGSDNEECYQEYLDEIMMKSDRAKPGAVIGFKLLYTHTRKHRGLLKVLDQQDFVFLHLIRRNIVRQAVSSMILRRRRAFIEEHGSAAGERYELDIEDFVSKAQRFQRLLDRHTRRLSGRDCLEVYYEDFSGERDAFYNRIFDFLGAKRLDLETSSQLPQLPRTDRRLETVVENFDELAKAAKAIGFEHMLYAP